MSNQVRFVHGTKLSDSPAKPFNGNSGHTNTKPDLARNRAELCFNMHGKITIVDYTKFVELFLPPLQDDKTAHVNIFENIPRPKGEPDMYKELLPSASLTRWLKPKAINDAKICPGFKLVATPYQADKTDSSKQAVDLGLYRAKDAPKREKDKPYPAVDWFGLDLPMECKADETEQDAFDENQPNGEPTGDKRRDALGQAFSYVELIVKRQHRMFVFMLFFLGNSVRIARFDRSGVFVTRKFDYKVDGQFLVDFLHRYSRLSDKERGYDPTVSRILPNTSLYNAMRQRANDKEEDDPRDYVRALFQKSLNTHWPWWKVEVHAHEPRGKTRKQRNHTVVRKFAVGMPHFQAPGVAGRGTRGYVALPVQDDDTIAEDAQFVYLKDAWRVDHDGIDREGVTLQFLNDKGVQFIPTLVCHGDLPGQTTKSQVHWKEFHPGEKKSPLKKHTHYRLVVKEVGLPLEAFRGSSSQLCRILFFCLQAHARAFKAGIIHRDISAGNMLLYRDDQGRWYGLLNDWELSKKVDDGPPEGRQPDRTGTWQYMSANALNDPTRKIMIQDELESFFHVLLYYAIRFFPHNLGDDHIGQFLHDYFDAYTPNTLGYRCGRAKLEAMQYGSISLKLYNPEQNKNVKLRFLWPSPPKPSTATLEPKDESSSSALSSSPSPAERALPPTHSISSAERSPSPVFSAIDGSDLTSLPSEPEDPPKDVNEPVHPLNEIIHELLSWFEAHYAFEDPPLPPSTQETAPADAPNASDDMGIMQLDEEDMAMMANRRGRKVEDTAEKLLEDEERRKNLETHSAMLALLYDSLNTKKWPADDKGPDKKPKEGYVPPKSAVPTNSTVTGSKRRSMDSEPEEQPGATKRSRT
ncbi:hypothetical protein GSI_03995 [Ganoderma sinense ZZ0214-1]|uniref:Fungal-type protein kinase domain-containing protein n=1 Tax=Ganoderma sinense ZZ0214-1 TaxID=1077348 RepID=A0A2G8SHX6_9APHY|nr:hypothetical protein GSI_03995 [Ganoderma sinense ZZ0214-1]